MLNIIYMHNPPGTIVIPMVVSNHRSKRNQSVDFRADIAFISPVDAYVMRVCVFS